MGGRRSKVGREEADLLEDLGGDDGQYALVDTVAHEGVALARAGLQPQGAEAATGCNRGGAVGLPRG